MKKVLFWLAVSLNVVLVTASAEEKQQEQAKQNTQTTVHPLATQLTNFGAFSCVARANQIARFLSGFQNGTTYIPKPPDNPDKRLLGANIIIQTKNSNYALATLSLAPNQSNGCGGSYQVINYETSNCELYIAKNLSNFKFVTINNTGIQIGDLGNGLVVIAMPAGSGCNIIKEEILK